jgi:hypothetical protein
VAVSDACELLNVNFPEQSGSENLRGSKWLVKCTCSKEIFHELFTLSDTMKNYLHSIVKAIVFSHHQNIHAEASFPFTKLFSKIKNLGITEQQRKN